jgi:tetratricopeptide (TPR) repeat protein
MRIRRLILLLVLPIAVVAATDDNSRAFAMARRKLMSGAEALKTDDRIALLEKTIKADPEDPGLKIALAKAFVQKLRETGDSGYLSRASKLVENVLSVQPRFDPALRLRNEIEMNLHRFPKVADYAATMLAGDPSDAPTLGLLGDALMEMGRYQRAGETYTRMVSIGGNLFSYNRLAYYNFVTGNPEAALGWMSQAIAAGSKSPENVAWCLSEMGDMLFKVGRIADAETAYRLALKTFPGYHRAHSGLGRLQASQGQSSEAIQSFQKAQAVVPLPEYAGALEVLFAKTGDAEDSARQRALLETVDKLMTVNGEEANRTLALIYADAGRNLAKALDLAKAEFEVRNDVYSYDALSWVLYKNGELPEAVKASEKALTLGTPEPSFYFHAGMIAAGNGDPVAARRHLEKALSLNPRFDVNNADAAKKALDEINLRAAGK